MISMSLESGSPGISLENRPQRSASLRPVLEATGKATDIPTKSYSQLSTLRWYRYIPPKNFSDVYISETVGGMEMKI